MLSNVCGQNAPIRRFLQNIASISLVFFIDTSDLMTRGKAHSVSAFAARPIESSVYHITSPFVRDYKVTRAFSWSYVISLRLR